MKKIVNKTTGDYYIGTGLDQINNNIRYQLNDAERNVKHNEDGSDMSGILSCPNMWEGMDTSNVEQSDVGLSGREVSCNFSTTLIWGYNLLNLNQSEWELL